MIGTARNSFKKPEDDSERSRWRVCVQEEPNGKSRRNRYRFFAFYMVMNNTPKAQMKRNSFMGREAYVIT